MNPGDPQGRGAVNAAFAPGAPAAAATFPAAAGISSYAATAVHTATDPTTGLPVTTFRNVAVGAAPNPAGGMTTVAYQFQQQQTVAGGVAPAAAATATYPYASLTAAGADAGGGGGGATLQEMAAAGGGGGGADDYKEDDYSGGGRDRAYDPEEPLAGGADFEDPDVDDDLLEDENALEAAGPLQDVYEPDVMADRGGFADSGQQQYMQQPAAAGKGGGGGGAAASDVSAMVGGGGNSALAGGSSVETTGRGGGGDSAGSGGSAGRA
ncbi:hypothetical protein HXX76_008192 [Chlamydomonas incerta]|uniref:Uncharacterized protein n=1 Tax=Chlamydomonas incerta TaxID=51695 RepID=A0A835T935_CHLIN|nr:hypothetical protein HXX76_008192 [Chlamydomonas incerta]|eukprot:KAG2433836.1 hypothetical protein HXX76_008192 [Chlamydomonas incerta]